MPKSWSSEKKRLEDDMLCDALKGRVKYLITSYRKSHDQTARFAVRIDDKEVIGGSFCGYSVKEHRLFKDLWEIYKTDNSECEHWDNPTYRSAYEKTEEILTRDSVFGVWDFAEALREYKQNKISTSIASENALVRMFAIVDRRLGRRTLEKIKNEVSHQPEWLRQFYRLRLDAEGIEY